jgi:hypothetical protein
MEFLCTTKRSENIYSNGNLLEIRIVIMEGLMSVDFKR